MVNETNRYTVAEAARVLGITETAVRARIQRGTLDSEREEGTVYVRLTIDEASAKSHEQSELVEALRAQIGTLNRQLDEANAANRENRRIIAALTQRIPAIEAPPDTPPEPSESPQTPPEPRSDTQGGPQEEEERRSWLYRFFFGP